MRSTMNTTTRKDRLLKAKAGVGKHFANVSSLTIAGAAMTPADLMALFQAEMDSMTAIANAAAALKVLRQAGHDTHTKVLPILRGLKSYVIGMYGNTDAASAILEDFGYKPRKSAAPKLETKVSAQEKAKATREARHTKGPKAKQAIKGTPSPATPATPKA